MRPSRVIAAVLLSCTTAIAGCHRTETLTPEAKAERGKTMLRQMSQTLVGMQAFSYRAEHHRSRPGASAPEVVTREVTVRRPNGMALVSDQGGAWYDGRSLTFVSNRNKAWARGPMPPTLDEALDFLSAEYAVPLPTGDLLYSSPYDALMTDDTTGGWVDVQNIGAAPCDHLAYSQAVVDWEIWLTQDERKLPCQFQITYKTEPGAPATRVTFSNFNVAPQIGDDTFTAKVPDGYQRIRLMRHATVEDTSVNAPAPADADTTKAAPSRQP